MFALAYQLYGGLKAVALTDIVQVSLLVLGGLLIGVDAQQDRRWRRHRAGFSKLCRRTPKIST